MKKEYLINKLREIIVLKLQLDRTPTEIGLEESLLELGLGMDSMSTLDFVLTLEKEFDVEIDESEVNIEVLSNINSIASYVYSLK